MTISKTIIRRLQDSYRRQFPEELVRYLRIKYKEEPFPYEYSEQDLYSNIKADISRYHAGTLDITIKSPYKRLEEDRDMWRSACITAEQENRQLRDRIMELELATANQEIDPEDIHETEKSLNSLPFM